MRQTLAVLVVALAGALVALPVTAAPEARTAPVKVCFKTVKVHGKLVRKRVACPKPKPKPAPTPKPTTTTPAPPAPAGSTRTNPLPLGGEIAVKDWKVKINSVNFDAWPLVQAANMFNDAPASGWVDVLVSLTTTYTGATKGTPWLDNDLRYLGASNVSYPQSGFSHDCGVAPAPRLNDFNDVFPGGTVTGNVCVQVQAADVPTLVGYWNALGSSTPGPWFALR